ncbi:MGMT family protein [Agaribacterium sp. ZY112]|uniref:MGMT family protein n=1 Tax=Agaribacterium sp. ZY112 TaxID=3233574 RepID=UPI003524C0BF
MKELNKQQIIWQVIASIPKGKVCSYGQVASLAGLANHARYVGSTLKKLPSGTQLPWHRVVNAKGELSFPPNSPAYQEQKKRLETEGICFIKEKIALATYAWKP